MPPQPKAKTSNRKFVEWINQGLKRSNWTVARVAQVGVLIALGVAVAALYLLQSSQIVTSTRYVEQLRETLTRIQQENAEMEIQITAATTESQVRQRAEALGFRPAANTVYVEVPRPPADDAPSIANIDRVK
jgi:uncharacterized protein HemX